MTTLTFAMNVTNPDAYDRKVMDAEIDTENAIRARQTPPGVVLLKSTGAERKSSYEVLINQWSAAEHLSRLRNYGAQADSDSKTQLIKILARDASDAQKNQAIVDLGG